LVLEGPKTAIERWLFQFFFHSKWEIQKRITDFHWFSRVFMCLHGSSWAFIGLHGHFFDFLWFVKLANFLSKKVSYLENFAVQAKTFKWGMPVPPTDLK